MSEDNIARFARQCGVIELCSPYGRPRGHPPLSDGYPPVQDDVRVAPDLTAESDVAAWLNYVATVRAIMNLAEVHRTGRASSPDDWERVQTYNGFAYVFPEQRDAGQFGVVVDAFLREAGTPLRFRWLDAGPAMLLGNGRTTAALAVELVQAVVREITARCSRCGRFYRRAKRRPTRSRMNFCEQCHADGTAARLRKARQRARRGSTDSM